MEWNGRVPAFQSKIFKCIFLNQHNAMFSNAQLSERWYKWVILSNPIPKKFRLKRTFGSTKFAGLSSETFQRLGLPWGLAVVLSSLLPLWKMTTGCYQKLDLPGIKQAAWDFKSLQLSLKTLACEYITKAELSKESQCFLSQLSDFPTWVTVNVVFVFHFSLFCYLVCLILFIYCVLNVCIYNRMS